EAVHQAWQTGEVVDFPLGAQERRDRLQLSSTLVGRKRELGEMIAALDRCCRGGNELFLLSGRPGSGKSALVRELQRSLVERRGAFVIGKCDAVTRTAPYAALAQSLRQLILQILGFTSHVIETWRQRIADAVGRNGQLIINLVPELERLLGVQPAVPAMPMAEAKNRFHLVLRKFIRVCAREEHPLAIALEDLHWADLATIELVEDLVCDSELAYTFWIGTYREGEVPPGHPVARLREHLHRAKAPICEQQLGQLSHAAVGQIVAATLQTSSSQIQPLIDLVHMRSEGNPLFIRALLETMYEHGILGFDPDSRSWSWDLNASDAATIPDDIAEVISQRLDDLAPQARSLLGHAAGLGGHFEVHLLSRL
ncbi:MAG: ATP-binding protein, partial [Nannocystaceae bacterium]